MTNYEDIIREAALKNRVSVKEDDVIMVVVTVMNRIVDDQIKALAASLDQHRIASQEIALGWRTEANKHANQILNAALDASREAMAKGMSEGASKVIAMVREEYEAGVAIQRKEFEKAILELRLYTSKIMKTIGVGLAGSLAIAILW